MHGTQTSLFSRRPSLRLSLALKASRSCSRLQDSRDKVICSRSRRSRSMSTSSSPLCSRFGSTMRFCASTLSRPGERERWGFSGRGGGRAWGRERGWRGVGVLEVCESDGMWFWASIMSWPEEGYGS